MRTLVFGLLALSLTAAPAQTVIFADSMSSFPAGWTLQLLSGSVNWTRMSTRSHSATYSAKCSNSASAYYANQHNLFKRAVNLTGYSAAIVSFWCWCYTENGYDSVMLDVHSRGGPWTRVWARTGPVATWESVAVNIPVVNTDSIRFRFKSDFQIQYEGAYIDDIVLNGYLVDVGVDSVVAPRGTVDTATSVFPSCFVRNFSPIPVSYWVTCRIEPSYYESTLVSNHAGFTDRQVYFSQWLAAPRGDLTVRCSTMLAADTRLTNDTASTTVRVRVHDVSCDEITSPTATIDSGFGVTPVARAANPGTETETFGVRMRMGSFYDDVKTVTLNAGGDTLVTFASRVVTAPRGTCTMKCSTMLSSDRNPGNNARTGLVAVLVHDVGTSAIVSPAPVVDSGAVIMPEAQVTNLGNVTESFYCRFRIGSAYADTYKLTGLAPGVTQNVKFRSWASVPGSYAMSCSTMLGTDLLTANNRVEASLFVRYLDAGITRILSPHSLIQPGPVTPRVEVRNHGNVTASNCWLTLTISPGGYSRTVVRTVPPATTDTFVFPTWNAALGTYQASAWLTLAGDMNPANDSARKTIVVDGVHHDVGVTAILSPGAVVDPGNITPRARVFNYGSATETNVPVVFWIELAADQVFADTEMVPTIGPGEERDVTFRTWLAYAGDFVVRSWTRLAGDEQPANDTSEQPVKVALHSVAPLEIVAPADTVGLGYPLAPKIRVANTGSVTDSFRVHLLIELLSSPVYLDSALCTVAAGDTAVVELPTWTPNVAELHQTTAWTALARDYDPSDDTIWDSFIVTEPVVDVGAAAIVAPSGLVEPGPVAPEVTVSNFGNVQVSFETRLRITGTAGDVYDDGAWARHLSPGETATVRLPVWLATPGAYSTLAVVRCAGDANAGNDTVKGAAEVRASGHWVERQSIPLVPSSRPVSKGGSITALFGTGALYALKGNKTSDFYSYTLAETIWDTMRAIPDGREAKKPKDGASLTTDGGRSIYATKGNNTRGFWRYDVQGDSWHQMPDVPLGFTNKKVKGGASLAYAMRSDSGCVYLLKGYRNEFLRFNTRADSWCSLQPAPAGVNVKWDKGSWIVSDGEHSIYAHKAKYHEFWRYDLVADSWIAAPLVAMPRTGSAGLKKTKEGSCAAWAGSAIYAFKGGNTQEFWLFMPGTNEWTELDTLPRYGSTMKNRKVKAGAGLACLDERVWALKGGKTREFWCYEPDTVVLARPGREGVQALPMAFVRGLALSICPNPAPRNTAVRLTCTWPPDARARLALYDAAGRRVSSFAVHRSSFAVRLAVPAGVYFVRLSAGPSLLARKLVIE